MTVRIQFQLRDEVARLLAGQAADRGVSRQAHVQDLIEECEDRLESEARGLARVNASPAEFVAEHFAREGEAGQ